MSIRLGSWGLPEFGITEKIQSMFSPQKAYASSGGSNLWGPQQASTPVSSGQNASMMNYSYNPYSTGTNPAQAGGGSAGGGYSPVNVGQQPMQMPMQEASGYQEPNMDAMYSGAFNALNQQEATLQPEYQTQLTGIENTYGQQKAGAEATQSQKLGEYGQQRTTEQGRTKSAIAEARRLAAESMQGIQSKFGGSTSAGGAYSEILGSQASRNIATNQAALQQTLSQIGQDESNVRLQTTNYLNELEQNTNLAKEKARNWLQQSLAQIATARGTLESEKANKRVEYLNQYNQTLQSINEQNTKFKQDVYLKQMDAQSKLDAIKAQKINQYQSELQMLEPFNVGNTQVQPATYGKNIYFIKGNQEDTGPYGSDTGINNNLDLNTPTAQPSGTLDWNSILGQ